MPRVTVSSKYQVVIPREVREQLRIRKGQKMMMLAIGNRIEMVADRDIKDMKGAFPGLSIEGIRDEEDRF